MARSRSRYSAELRQKILGLARSGQSPEELAKTFDPTAKTIRKWIAQDTKPVLAAGGVLERRTLRGLHVAVVHRKRYGGDWVLPKGKLEAEEGLADAALREVKEETGWRARIAGPAFLSDYIAGPAFLSDYKAGGVPKEVIFFRMTAVEEEGEPDKEEVEEVQWLQPQAALKKLTHPSEQSVLRQATAAGDRKRTKPNRLDELRRERLEASLEQLQGRIAFLKADKNRKDEHSLSRAFDAVAIARAALDRGDMQIAWAQCHQARRFLYRVFEDQERKDRAAVLRCEASDKLENWRKDAILEVIDRDPEAVSTERLVLAQQLLDEHFENVYFKLAQVASRVNQLLWLLLLVAGSVFALSWVMSRCGPSAAVDERSFLYDPYVTLVILLLGAVGATLSNTLSTIGIGGRIPVLLQKGAIGYLRPVVGAVSAILVAVVLESKFPPITVDGERTLYAFAAAAGFSDRLLNRVLSAVVEAAEK